jgi:hypothetical protein
MKTKSTPNYKQYFYLILAIVGGSLTIYLWATAAFIDGRLEVMRFIDSTWTRSYYAKSLTIDFWTVIFATILFMTYEGRRIRLPYYGIYVIISLSLAIALGFPLFLFMRERWLTRNGQ